MQLSDIGPRLTKQPFFTLYEPVCGSGCMVIEMAEILKTSGYNPTRRGELVIGNALTNERHRVMYTPVHWLGNWSCRLRKNRQQHEVQTV